MATTAQRKAALSAWVMVAVLVSPLPPSRLADAQPRRPDFTGQWSNPTPVDAPDAEGPATRGSRGSGWGKEFTVVQRDGVLSVTRVLFSRYDLQPALTLRFALDGSPSVNMVLMGRGAQSSTSTAAWDGDTLVITTRYEVSAAEAGSPLTYQEVRRLSLQPPETGRLAWPPTLSMKIVREGALGGPPSTTRLVYSRAY